jgi:hypothetical protein
MMIHNEYDFRKQQTIPSETLKTEDGFVHIASVIQGIVVTIRE